MSNPPKRVKRKNVEAPEPLPPLPFDAQQFGELFPPAGEVFPEWQRPPGTRGRLTNAMRADRDAYNARRDQYAAARELAELLMTCLSLHADGITERDEVIRQLQGYAFDLGRNLNASQQAFATLQGATIRVGKETQTIATIIAELSLLLGEEVVPTTQLSHAPHHSLAQAAVLTSSRAVFRISFDPNSSMPTLVMEPRDRKLAPREVPVGPEGLTANGLLVIKGHLGLTTDSIPLRLQSELRRTTPQPSALPTLPDSGGALRSSRAQLLGRTAVGAGEGSRNGSHN